VIVFGGVPIPRMAGTIAAFGDGATYDPVAQQWSMLKAGPLPSGRFSHTAIWTGREMIVWGGVRGPSPLGDGASYDPIAESWTAVATEGAPSARYAHSAIWTGTEMIVWGGLGCSSNAMGPLPCVDGGAYNVTSRSWRPVSLRGAPQPSGTARAVWADGKMLVWGGSNSPGGGVYDPVADQWAPMATGGQPSPRDSHLALWTGNELLVWGGLVAESVTNDGGRFRLSP
jgi:N-acetylneuraminic acid mutarotase